MALLASPLMWTILALSIGISVLFITGTRYLAYRMAGQPEMVSAATSPNVFVIPTLPANLLRRALRVSPLLLLLSAGLGIILLRFVYGLGSVTNLSNQYPLGIWIGFDVMCGVALAAGAFVLQRHPPLGAQVVRFNHPPAGPGPASLWSEPGRRPDAGGGA